MIYVRRQIDPRSPTPALLPAFQVRYRCNNDNHHHLLRAELIDTSTN